MELNLKDLLDKTYELEGLIHLALKRNESTNDLLRLISKKVREICISCPEATEKSLDINIVSGYDNTDSNFSIDDYSIDEEVNNEDNAEEEALEKDHISHEEAKTDLPQRGKLVFTINDKFRYKKELFNNSEADFNNTLVLIASMDNFEEAEDYFINEVGFDLSNPFVKEFLSIIKRYFL